MYYKFVLDSVKNKFEKYKKVTFLKNWVNFIKTRIYLQCFFYLIKGYLLTRVIIKFTCSEVINKLPPKGIRFE